MAEATGADWAAQVYEVLRADGIRQLCYVPDAGLSGLIGRAQADPEMVTTVLTSEQEGVGLVCGAWLGGQRAVLLMQSSGVGNCVNLFSLLGNCRFPFLTIVTMRGEWGEFNPWQVPMGRATRPVFELMGIQCHAVAEPDQLAEAVEAAAHMAFSADQAAAVLIGQRLIGRKVW